MVIAKRVVIVLVVAGLIGALIFSQLRGRTFRVSGVIESSRVNVGTLTGGRVSAVHVQQGDQVQVGDVLVEFETSSVDALKQLASAYRKDRAWELHRAERYRVQTDFAPRNVVELGLYTEHLQDRLGRLRNGQLDEEVEAAAKQLEQAKARHEAATAHETRTKELFEEEAATQRDLDRAAEDVDAATKEVDVRRHDLKRLTEGTPEEALADTEKKLEETRFALEHARQRFRQENVARAKAGLEVATAFNELADTLSEETRITSPINGTVDFVNALPGQLLRPAASVAAVVSTTGYRVRTHVPANRAGLQVGSEVWLKTAAFPGESFRGEIAFVAPRAEFTPTTAHMTDDTSLQVYRIELDLLEGTERLRPGLAVDIFFSRDEATP